MDLTPDIPARDEPMQGLEREEGQSHEDGQTHMDHQHTTPAAADASHPPTLATATAPSTTDIPPLHHEPAATTVSAAATATKTEEDLKAATVHSMEYHRLALKEKIESSEQGKTAHYISPSDGIMSPATQKLSNIKGKRFNNAGKGQNLFAKALGKKSFQSRISAAGGSATSNGSHSEQAPSADTTPQEHEQN
ncbi:hypothetical protein KEM52_002934 [Ascosphaera acerosa]|nr:hypothetical protein KEM52_002934 [Ascosphaera acerosa]